MKILVIGGTGFIGRHLCPFLANEHHVVIMARNHPAVENPPRNIANISYRQGDITNRDQVFAAMEGVDYVVNLSSTVIPSTSNLNPVFDVQTNLVGALNILDAAVEHKIKKLVFISSGGTVYGEGTGKPFKEDDPTNPICSYGVVKLAIEKYIQMYHHLYGLPYAILRVSNPYGPGQVSEKALGVVSIFTERIKNKEVIEIWGDGSVKRDFVFINDVVTAINCGIFSDRKGVVVNVGSGTPLSLVELVDEVSCALNVSPRVEYKSFRSFDVKTVCLDIERANLMLDWRPSYSLGEGLALMV